jgi:hypothetical protein
LALHATGMWLATRLVYVALTFLAVAFSSPGKTTSVAGLLLQHWERLDTNWYVNISRYGYWTPTAATFARDGGQMPTAFFPLYPLLIKATSALIGDSQRTLSALLVANLGTLLAFIAMAFFAAQEDGMTAGTRTLRLAVAYPLAFFLAAGYTDGLFFGLAVFALFFARRGCWYAAALCAFVAGLTRITALALILPLTWEYARQHGWWTALATRARRLMLALPPVRAGGARQVALAPGGPSAAWSSTPLDGAPETTSSTRERSPGGRPRRRLPSPRGSWRGVMRRPWRALPSFALGFLVIGAVPLGIGLYMRYLALTFGDPLSFIHAAQLGWYHVALPPWQSVPMGIGIFFSLPPWSYAQAQIMLDLGAVLIFTLLTLVAARRQPVAFTLYMVGLIVLAVTSPTIFPGNANIFSSAGRYLIPSAPIFLVLSRWTAKRPALESLLVDGGFLLQAALATLWLAVAAYVV